jgi:peptide deformylase
MEIVATQDRYAVALRSRAGYFSAAIFHSAMILPVVKYGSPVLRQKGERPKTITPALRQLILDMFETMYHAKGVGLAAQQVGHALQVAVVDVRGMTDRPSTMEIDGQPVDVDAHMPMALVNPDLTPTGDPIEGAEGCLSFPEIYADIVRPRSVRVKALNGEGRPVEFHCGGLLARAVQHETDHLHGILFIDRMSRETKAELKAELEDLQLETKALLGKS